MVYEVVTYSILRKKNKNRRYYIYIVMTQYDA